MSDAPYVQPSAPGPSKEDSAPGMIPKRISLPTDLWEEVLEVSRKGKVDYRDTLLVLVDLGLQAQSEDRLKSRFVSIPAGTWDKLSKLDVEEGHEQEALTRVVDLGVQAYRERLMPQGAKKEEDPEPQGTIVRVDLLGERGSLTRLGETRLPQIPARGDAITIGANSYEVKQRAWVIGKREPIAYLRVKGYGSK